MTAASERLEPTWDPRCGTMGKSGYQAHIKRGEHPCEPCSMARWAADVVQRVRAEAEKAEPSLSPDLPGEKWREVANTGGLYQVSSEGRVRFMGSTVPYRLPHDARVAAGGRYGHLSVSIGGRPVSLHRTVAEAFCPNPENYPLVRHLDGDPSNNAARNLAWGTPSMNMADARRHGTLPTALHGTRSKYNAGCRCDNCRAADRARDRARQANPEVRAIRNAQARARRAARRATAATDPKEATS